MSLIINHNISAMNTNNNLRATDRMLGKSLEKLSSGYKINVASDDPSGLIISEQLRSQANGLDRAIRNSQEASNVIGITEGALIEMNEILRKLRALALHASNSGITAPDQIAADQQEVDSSVQTIDRIANTTSYSDQYLLNGSKGLVFDRTTVVDDSMDHRLLNTDMTRVDQVFKRTGAAMAINFSGIKSSSQSDYTLQAQRAYFEADPNLTDTEITGTKLSEEQSFILTGVKGTRQFNFAEGTDLGTIVDSINNVSDSMGVSATLIFDSTVTPVANGGTWVSTAGARATGTVQVYGVNGNGATPKVNQVTAAGVAANRFLVGKTTDGEGRVYAEVASVTGNNTAGTVTMNVYKDKDKTILLGTASSVFVGGVGTATFTPAAGSGLVANDITIRALPASAVKDDVYTIGLVGSEVNGTNDGVDASGLTMTGLGAAGVMNNTCVISGVDLGKNTDVNGKLYFKASGVNTARTIEVYKTSEMRAEDLVATGTASLAAANRKIQLEAVNDSNLNMTLNFTAAANNGGLETGYISFDEIGMRVYAEEYGSDQYLRVQNFKGNLWGSYREGDSTSLELIEEGTTKQALGSDATITVNGTSLQTNGLSATVTTQDYSGALTFNAGKLGATTLATAGYESGSLFSRASALQSVTDAATPTIVNTYTYATNARKATGERLDNFIGGMQYQLGAGAGDQERTVYGIPSMAAANLGKLTIDGRTYTLQDVLGGGIASLAKDPVTALQVISQAIDDVSSLRARLGAFQSNMLQTNINSLEVAVKNITSTESALRDANMAVETTEFTKNQILLQAGTAMLAQANTASQNILQLLG